MLVDREVCKKVVSSKVWSIERDLEIHVIEEELFKALSRVINGKSLS